MDDLEIGLAIAGWLLGGLFNWYVLARYYDREITVDSLYYIPLSLLIGLPMLPLTLWEISSKPRLVNKNRVLKSWK